MDGGMDGKGRASTSQTRDKTERVRASNDGGSSCAVFLYYVGDSPFLSALSVRVGSGGLWSPMRCDGWM